MEWVPTLSVLVESAATPPFSVAAPSTRLPLRKVTVPLGVVPRAGWTAALKMTACPRTEGLAEEEAVVVVGDGTIFTAGRRDLPSAAELGDEPVVSARVLALRAADGSTTWDSAAEVLAASVELPL